MAESVGMCIGTQGLEREVRGSGYLPSKAGGSLAKRRLRVTHRHGHFARPRCPMGSVYAAGVSVLDKTV